MTLVVALICNDGIVMASDGQVTLQSSGGPVRQSAIKIKRFGESILWSGSGEVGFIQKIDRALNGLPNESKKRSIEELRQQIIDIIYTQRHRALVRSRELHGKEEGDRKASYADTLFCAYEKGKPKIIHITADAKDEDLEEFGYAASGIGDTFAYTLLRGRDIKSLSCDEGKVLAYKVIRESIDVGAFGLGEPIDIWVISETEVKGKETIKICRVPEEEIAAIHDVYTSLKQAEEEIFKKSKLGP